MSARPPVFEQAETLTTLYDKRLAGLIDAESPQRTRRWSNAQDRLATGSTNSQVRIAEATHRGLLDDEHRVEPSAPAHRRRGASIRTGAPVMTR